MKLSFVRLLLLGSLISLTSPAISASAPPTSPEAKSIEALVAKAAGEIEKKGKATFPEFRKKGSEWLYGDTYIFVYTLDGTVILNAAFPNAEGGNPATSPAPTDRGPINPQAYSKEFIETVKTKGSGWVGYMYTRPGSTEPTQKWSFVKKVTIDGTQGLVGAGFYPK